MKETDRIDLHMHSTVSDGTDTPIELLSRVREAGIGLFALTDHDAVDGCEMILAARQASDPVMIPGVEFTCRDTMGEYHILGYGYDVASPAILKVVQMGHYYRLHKLEIRLEGLKDRFGIQLTHESVLRLKALSNPGKPHLALEMIKEGFAAGKEEAIERFINLITLPQGLYVTPEDAISGILEAGGIPVLAHPPFGSGSDFIVGEALEERVRRLMARGLKGLETYYSGFDEALRAQVKGLADKYGLYITAGSDYHGKTKKVALGETGRWAGEEPEGLKRFLSDLGLGDEGSYGAKGL